MEHLTQQQIEDYSQNRLRAAELLAVSDHLDACEQCRHRAEAGLSGDAAFFAVHADTFADNGHVTVHLTDEQAADYVDKGLSGDELQFVVDHVGSCEACAVAVEDLRAFRNQIAPSLDREYRPADIPAVAGRSWREKFASVFRVSPVPAFASAALAIFFLVFIGWLIWRTPREENPEIVIAPTPSLQPAPSAVPTAQVQPEPVPVVVQLNDGANVVSLDQEGKLSGADNLPPAYQNILKKALTSQRIERSSQLQGLTRPPSSLMGANDKQRDFAVIEPAANVLLTNRPTFRWSNMEGVTGYVVEVYDEQFKLVTSSPEITGGSWTTSRALPRGRVYSWQVKAIKDGQETTVPRPPAPQAKFRVLDQAKADELAKAKRDYASSHLTLGLLYAEAGLLKEAEQELRTLRRANPESEIVRNLLRQVQAQSRAR